jgi:NAD(P)-dependent dehydrogenase (short-subunit alcohol dehydrogenase family)
MTSTGPLAGKIALVTGASRGIGRGIALQLTGAGATVYITGRAPDASYREDKNKGVLPSLEQTAKGKQ